MKIKGEKYEIMCNAFMDTVKHYGFEACKEIQKKSSTKQMLWTIWNRATDQLNNDDNHPAFKAGVWKRYCKYRPEFDVYSDNVNDNHIESVLNICGRLVGLNT